MYSSISTNKVYAFGGDISNHFTPYSSLLDSKWRRHFQEYVRRIFVVAAPTTEYSKRSFFFKLSIEKVLLVARLWLPKFES